MNNKNHNQIINTLNRHGGVLKKLEKQLDKQGKTLEKHSSILEKHSSILERHTQMLVKHEYDISEIKETMATKDDINRVMTAIENFASRTQSNEQQIIIGGHQLMRTDARIDKVEADVKLIKPLVGLR